MGVLNEIDKIVPLYEGAIVSIGNNEKREELLGKIFKLVTLIYPSAYVSLSANICAGLIVMPESAVHTNVKVGQGCKVSIGASIDYDADNGDYCHINTGAIICAGAKVEHGMKVEAGETV